MAEGLVGKRGRKRQEAPQDERRAAFSKSGVFEHVLGGAIGRAKSGVFEHVRGRQANYVE